MIAFANALFVACTVVLAHKAGAGRVEGGHHIIGQRVGIGGSGIGGHHGGIKAVHACLHKQAGGVKHRILQRSGQAQPQKRRNLAARKANVRRGHTVFLAAHDQRPQQQKARSGLRNGAGCRHTGHAPAKADDKNQVEHNV